MACIVGATRVLCGLHFIRDVLIGAGISVVLGIIDFMFFLCLLPFRLFSGIYDENA
ncbi:MAG: hypothetical protein ACLR13_06820 [Acutalibacteraceae bacterium]